MTPDFSTWLFGAGSIVWYVLLVVISHNTGTDAYNAFNSGVVLSKVQTFATTASALDRPATILQGRLFRFGIQARW